MSTQTGSIASFFVNNTLGSNLIGFVSDLAKINVGGHNDICAQLFGDHTDTVASAPEISTMCSYQPYFIDLGI